MPEDKNGITYSFDVCSQCKSICCQDAKPPLTEKRKKILSEFIEKQKISVSEPFSKEQYCYPAVDDEVYCKLFNKQTGKCSVHPVKPETCVSGPVTFDINFNAKKVEWFLKKDELCAFAGILYKNQASFKDHLEIAKKQIMQLISELSAEELRAIMKVEEPLTFKVGEDDLPAQVALMLGLK